MGTSTWELDTSHQNAQPSSSAEFQNACHDGLSAVIENARSTAAEIVNVRNGGMPVEVENVCKGGAPAAPGVAGETNDADLGLLSRQFSRSSLCESENEEDVEQEQKSFLVSPIVALKDQLEKDKDDESLRRWKEKLLGSLLLDPVEGLENIEPKVDVLNFTILSHGRPETLIPLPLSSCQKNHLFNIKEGCTYKIKFTFLVRRNIVSGLTYIHTVWKNGFKVENTKTMLGTFGPQVDPYTHTTEEETTPSGIFARGTYTSRIRFLDDDGRSYLDIQHTFVISKEWQ